MDDGGFIEGGACAKMGGKPPLQLQIKNHQREQSDRFKRHAKHSLRSYQISCAKHSLSSEASDFSLQNKYL